MHSKHDILQKTPQEILQWRIKTAKDVIKQPFCFRKPSDIVKHFSTRKAGTRAIPIELKSGSNDSSIPKFPNRSHTVVDPSSQQLIRVRERLGDLCEWKSAALDTALSLASSIEVFMNEFFPATPRKDLLSRSEQRIDYLDWSLETRGLTPSHHNAGPNENYGAQNDYVTIPIRRPKDEERWEVDIGKLDAVLSLWMATIEAQSEAPRNDCLNGQSSKSADPSSTASNWRRRKAGINLQYRFCRLLGDDFEEGPLKRDIFWWVDELVADQSDDPDTPEKQPLGENMQETLLSSASEYRCPNSSWTPSKARKKDIELMIGFNGYKRHEDASKLPWASDASIILMRYLVKCISNTKTLRRTIESLRLPRLLFFRQSWLNICSLALCGQ